MTDTAFKEKTLEHSLARELRALDEQAEQDRETEFYLELEQLLGQCGLTAREAARLVRAEYPDQTEDAASDARPGSAVKVFRNPYTREVVKTRGFNHHTLSEWRKRHGRLTVQTWRIK